MGDYKVSDFNYIYECDDGSIRMYNSMTGLASLLSVDDVSKKYVIDIINNPENLNGASREIIDILAQKGYLVPEERDESNLLKVKTAETVLNEGYLNLIIMPTEQCNFRCPYCYEDFIKSKMSKDTQNGIISYVNKNIRNYSGLSVSWFGGEPLLAIDVIEYLSENFIKICKCAKRTYVSGITTNGYLLTKDVFKKLYKLKVTEYQVTLDGYREQHDSQRVLVNGQGTFDTIVSNLIAIRDTSAFGTAINLRTNFTKSIADNIDEYLLFYKKTFNDDSRFSFYISQAEDWGGERVKAFNGLIDGDISKFVLKKLKEYGIALNHTGHCRELERGFNTCYAAMKNSFVIGADSTIYKCTVHFKLPENHVGIITKDGKMELNDNIYKWIKPIVEIPNKCKICFNRASCLPIRCPYDVILNDNDNDNDNGKECPPMGGVNLADFMERFNENLFYHISIKGDKYDNP